MKTGRFAARLSLAAGSALLLAACSGETGSSPETLDPPVAEDQGAEGPTQAEREQIQADFKAAMLEDFEADRRALLEGEPSPDVFDLPRPGDAANLFEAEAPSPEAAGLLQIAESHDGIRLNTALVDGQYEQAVLDALDLDASPYRIEYDSKAEIDPETDRKIVQFFTFEEDLVSTFGTIFGDFPDARPMLALSEGYLRPMGNHFCYETEADTIYLRDPKGEGEEALLAFLKEVGQATKDVHDWDCAVLYRDEDGAMVQENYSLDAIPLPSDLGDKVYEEKVASVDEIAAMLRGELEGR